MNDKENKTTLEAPVTRPYTLRSLKDKDLWTVIDIVCKVLPGDTSKTFAEIILDEKKDVCEIGAEIVVKLGAVILKNMQSVHDELYGFLSDVSGIPAEEIEEMEFGTAPLMVWDIIENGKNASFFKVVSRLLL